MEVKGTKLVLAACLMCFALNAQSQDHNLGLYELLYHSGGVATYQLVWSEYNPAVMHEPPRPGDVIYVPPSNCHPDAGCNEIQSYSHNISSLGGIQSIGAIPDRIFISCGALCGMGSSLLWAFALGLQGGGGGPSEPELRLREVDETSMGEDGPCNDEEFTPNEDIPLTADEQQRLFDFLNSADAQALWDHGRFGNVGFMRVEQAGFLLPDGTFQRGNVQSQGPCNIQLHDAAMPEGTILVHTHPWSRGERLDQVCPPP